MRAVGGRHRTWRGVAALVAALAVCAAAASTALAAMPRALRLATVPATASPSADCTIYSGQPTDASRCGPASYDTVGNDGNGYLYRTMISFAGGLGIPAGSQILSSTLTIDVAGAFGSTPAWIFSLTRSFSPGAASWNTYDGVHSWTTAGGDFNDQLQASATVSGAGTVSFSVTKMTQAWLDGTDPVPALMMLPYAGKGNAFTFSSHASGSNGPYLTIAYQPPSSAGPPPPVMTTPVSTPLPRPTARRGLKVKLVVSWTWNRAITRLRTVKVGSLPHGTQLYLRCLGRGCPKRSKATAVGASRLRRLLRSLAGRRYRAGNRLLITLTAPGYLTERAEVIFRNGRLPQIKLLSRG